jgi:hypothetical protein
MGILFFILLTLGLLACNLIYCGQRIMTDLRLSRHAEAALGLFAICGALAAGGMMAWAATASLAHL